MQIHWRADPISMPHTAPWTEGLWGAWSGRQPFALPARMYGGVDALLKSRGRLAISAVRRMEYPAIVAWSGAGRYAVLDEAGHRQLVDPLADPDRLRTQPLRSGLEVHVGPGASLDAADAVELAGRLALSGPAGLPADVAREIRLIW